MDLKKKIKGFFTLTRKSNGGFTLVELIVVIAILAILGGVAVPAYSGYVTKANKEADRLLISEIEQALTLAYYNGDLVGGSAGYIMLLPNDAENISDGEDTPTDIALKKTFGDNWLDTMQLKYDSWSAKNMKVSYEDATAVVNSNFTQKYTASELMEQVKAITDAVNGLQVQFGGVELNLYNMYGYTDANGAEQNAIIDVMKKYGVGQSEADWEALDGTKKSNLLVLASAHSINSNTGSAAAGVLPNYAQMVAFAAENEAFNAAYKTFQSSIANVDPNSADSQYTQIKNAYDTLQAAADAAGFETWQTTNNNATTHTNAFSAVMSGVDNAMKDNGDAILDDLGNAEMFTSGVGSKMYEEYLNTAYAAAGSEATNELWGLIGTEGFEGAVVVQYIVSGENLYVTNSLPAF